MKTGEVPSPDMKKKPIRSPNSQFANLKLGDLCDSSKGAESATKTES
jgi:hypothetical protein